MQGLVQSYLDEWYRSMPPLRVGTSNDFPIVPHWPFLSDIVQKWWALFASKISEIWFRCIKLLHTCKFWLGICKLKMSLIFCMSHWISQRINRKLRFFEEFFEILVTVSLLKQLLFTLDSPYKLRCLHKIPKNKLLSSKEWIRIHIEKHQYFW